jgi:Pyridoxamine 5'-phosphate oxidase
VSWRELEAAAPELARRGRELLERRSLVMLGTLRADGSPRVSPVDTLFAGDELVFGVMTNSGKARDLRGDPRCALQTIVTETDGGEPELKLYGRAARSRVNAGWWRDRPADAEVYGLEVAEAVVIEWDVGATRMRVRRWTPTSGTTVVERAYP